MKRLSLPVERETEFSPKHEQHGTPIGALINRDVKNVLESMRRGK